MKQIKIFTSDCCYNNIVERRANEWIERNNVKVISIDSSNSFWNGYKCTVVYEK